MYGAAKPGGSAGVGTAGGAGAAGVGTNLVGRNRTLARANAFGSTKRAKECPNCRDAGRVVYDTHSGDELCAQCGQVLESRVMSEEQEWRSFSNNDGGGGVDRSRVGGVNDAWLDSGVQGSSMLGGDKKFSRLTQMHESASALSSGDRMLRSAFSNLRSVAEFFDLRECSIERCKEMVKDMQAADLLRTRTGTLYMVAVVFLVAREEKLFPTLKEYCKYDQTLTERDLAKAINKIKKSVAQSASGAANSAVATVHASAELVPRYAAQLSLSQHLIEVAQQICRETERIAKGQYRPNMLAAAAIYLTTQLHNVQVPPAEIATVSKSAFQQFAQVYNKILPYVKRLLPPTFVPLNIGGFQSLKRIEIPASTPTT